MDKELFEKNLAEEVAKYYDDPLGYIMFAFPWGTKDTILEDFSEPDEWQKEYLITLGKQISDDPEGLKRFATASSHGVGKSALSSMIILWFMSTRYKANVVVTANTANQLYTKTFRELNVWRELAINGHWFEHTAQKMTHISSKDWICNAIPNNPQKPEAIAGTHGEHVLVIFDEASAIDYTIYEAIYGAMSTARAIWLTFGNPTRSNGPFYDSFHSQKHRWTTNHVDGRNSSLTNKALIEQFIEDYGIDSDIVKVRWLGEFPNASDDQLIPTSLIDEASSRTLSPTHFSNYPIVFGVDVARSGSDESVIVRRQGPKCQVIGRYLNLDLMELSNKVVELYRSQRPDEIFVDATGLGAGVYDRLKELRIPVTEVNFGTQAVDKRSYAQTRSEIWGLMRDWLDGEVEIPPDRDLIKQLKQQTYGYNNRMQIQLVSKMHMKASGLDSPDIADALALTFYPQSIRKMQRVQARRIIIPSSVGWS